MQTSRRKASWKIVTAALGASLTVTGTAVSAIAGQPVTAVTIEERIQGSDLVVAGKVREIRPMHYRSPHGDDLIVSHVTLDVSEKLKGEDRASVDMIVEGGALDGVTLRVSDQPVVQRDDELVAFLNETPDGFKPHRRGLGVLRLEPGQAPGSKRVMNSSLTLDMIREKARTAQ